MNQSFFPDAEDFAGDCTRYITELFSVTNLDVRPGTVDWNPPYLNMELVGEDAAAIFGRYGEYLDSLQYLVNQAFAKRYGREKRLILDAGGYRERRAQTLRKLALDLAAQVKSLGQEAELDPLPPQERRIIHNTLADDPEVTTYSEGMEPNRYVVITPRIG
ncbi:MAG: hypothetical protein M1330_03760 [Armatimonadetes bacterium]|nr:hypothetical protein [Armatimonadota bacterium]